MKSCKCGSYAINENKHGREEGVDLDLCDVCYWRERAARVEAMTCDGWQPIESAPKDGTYILAINARTNPGRQHVVHYSERYNDRFTWVTDSAPMSFVNGITHWMPLPEPPQEWREEG